MAHMVVCVLNRAMACPDLVEAWTAAGAPGVTILESSGIRHDHHAATDDLPLFPSLRDLQEAGELHHRTVFCIVHDEESADRLLEVAEQALGKMGALNTGIAFIVPVTRVLGLGKRGQPS